MKKFIILALAILALSIAANCSASPISEGKSNPAAPVQDNKIIEAKKNELEEKAAVLISEMTLEEKVGQLLIVGFPPDTKADEIQDYIDRYRVSGFILFRRNYMDFDSQYALIKSLKEKNGLKNPLPLFVSVDEEGGTVSRLPKGGTHFPDAKLVGKAGDPELAYKTGEVIGQELRASGINLNFAPVLDIVSSSENTLLIKRSYGNTAEAVSIHGTAFINGIQSAGVIASPKHFPGHGSTSVDSHGKLPVINIDRNTFQSRELVPFKTAVDAGLDAVMVGHLAYPKLDPSGLPATMSSYFLTDVLRKEMGFKGISISDEIEMYGYMNGKATLEECVVTSFNAGLDMFVIGHTKKIQDKVLKALIGAWQEGRISEQRLNESVLRIIKVKLKHKLSDTMEYSLEEARNNFTSKEHKSVLEELNGKIKAIK
ncbi:MAG: beta-N-acetylhexosaminidase [Clostridia bacterium]